MFLFQLDKNSGCYGSNRLIMGYKEEIGIFSVSIAIDCFYRNVF